MKTSVGGIVVMIGAFEWKQENSCKLSIVTASEGIHPLHY
jgi:hypothetical protein